LKPRKEASENTLGENCEENRNLSNFVCLPAHEFCGVGFVGQLCLNRNRHRDRQSILRACLNRASSVRSAEQQVRHHGQYLQRHSWGTWKSLTGTVSSDASCTSDGKGDVFCAAVASNGDLQVTILNSGVWSTPTNVTAALYSAPSCAELSAGEVMCAARSSSGGLAYSIYNRTSWSAFKTVLTSAVSAPSCATDNAGRIVCALYTVGGTTLANRYTAGAWEGFLNLGGSAAGNPICSSVNSGGKVACFGEAYNSGMIYGAEFLGGLWTPSNWTAYGALGGAVSNNANCTTQAAGLAICGAIGELDGAFDADVYNGSSWEGWVKVGGTGLGIPACGALGTGQVVCVVMGINNKLTSVVGS
jgi:hypothetical protein